MRAHEVPKWIDEQGAVHYGGPPPDAIVDIAGLETFEYSDACEISEPNYKSNLECAEELEKSRLACDCLRAREAAQSSACLIVVRLCNKASRQLSLSIYPQALFLRAPGFEQGIFRALVSPDCSAEASCLVLNSVRSSTTSPADAVGGEVLQPP
jgi:hypothetical protein